MSIIYLSKITEDDVENNSDVLFIFADNAEEKGGSQLARDIRGLDNAKGIRVKKLPSNSAGAFYDDEELSEAMSQIEEDLAAIEDHAKSGGVVITSYLMFQDERLREHSPEIFFHVQEFLRGL